MLHIIGLLVNFIAYILFFTFLSLIYLSVYRSAGDKRLHNSSKTIPNVNILAFKALYKVRSPFQNLSFGL